MMRGLFAAYLCLGTAVFAQGGMGPGPGMVHSSGSDPFSVTATDNSSDTSASSPVTYTGLSIGATGTNRVIAAGVGSRNAGGIGAISSLTIGGISATKAIAVTNGAGDQSAEIWYASVPTGTTANVVVTYTTGAYARGGIQLWRVISATGNAPTATATGVDNATDTQPIDTPASVTIPSGGAAMGVIFTLLGGPGTPTGSPSGFNLDMNINIVTTQNVWALHSAAGAFTGSQTLSTTLTGSALSGQAFATAVWGP